MLARPMRGPLPRMPADGQGSGCIVDASGYILTNYHVVRDASEINVSLADGRRVPAQIVGYDPPTDLAVLKIDADKLTAAEWGDSETAEVGRAGLGGGQPVWPGADDHVRHSRAPSTAPAWPARPIRISCKPTPPSIPATAAARWSIASGRVIGINTAIVGDAYQGISFAIPSNVAREVFERIQRRGRGPPRLAGRGPRSGR